MVLQVNSRPTYHSLEEMQRSKAQVEEYVENLSKGHINLASMEE